MELEKVKAYCPNVNWRRQNAGKEKGSMACDIDLEFYIDGPTFLAEVAVESPPKGWGEVFWDKDGVPRVTCIGLFEIDREFTRMDLTIEQSQEDLFDDGGLVAGLVANLKKLRAEVAPKQQLKVKGQFQMEPSPDVWDHLVPLKKLDIVFSAYSPASGDQGYDEGGDDSGALPGMEPSEGDQAAE